MRMRIADPLAIKIYIKIQPSNRCSSTNVEEKMLAKSKSRSNPKVGQITAKPR